MTEIVSFGEWVQIRRNQLRLSRTDFAQIVGCSPVTIKKIERDERRPSTQIAELLAQHLQIPESEQDNFLRRARGEFVARFGSPEEITLAEAQTPTAEENEPKHNLPPQTTPFFGRETELEDIANRIADPNCRLLTILGAGGMGKTRLSIEAARGQLGNFTDGIVFVPLAPVSADYANNTVNPVAGAFMDALNVSFQGDDPPERQLLTYLQRKEMLVVFDNFEHLLATAVYMSDILNHAPDIIILVTSRESLNIQEEWLFTLKGLPYPQQGQAGPDTTTYSAIQMFAQRAIQSKASFDLKAELDAVQRICELVEGMPLGLELAAAWVRQLSCAEIASAISSEIDFLTTRMRNVPERHRSVRAVFTSSWQRLSAKEQLVLQKLSVFRGGFTPDAAQEVAGASLLLLSKLVDQSLVGVGENGRYYLHELLRQFAAEKLAQSSLTYEAIHNQHTHYYMRFVADQEPRIKGAEAKLALLAMTEDIDNIRAAIQSAVQNQVSLLDRPFATTMWMFYEAKGWFLEAETTFGLIISRLLPLCASENNEEQTAVASKCLRVALFQIFLGAMQARLNRLNLAEETIQLALERLRLLEETPESQWLIAFAGYVLGGDVVSYKGEVGRAVELLKTAVSLAQSTGDRWLYAKMLLGLNQVLNRGGHFQESEYYLKQAAQLFAELNEQIESCYVWSDLGRLAMNRGDWVEAERFLEKGIAQRNRVDYRTGMAYIFRDLGNVARLQGHFSQAKVYFQQGLAKSMDINLPGGVSLALWGLANLAVAEGDYETALDYFQKNELGDLLVGGPGWAMLGLEHISEARAYFETCLRRMLNYNDKLIGLDALVGMAHVKARLGQLRPALELLVLVRHHPSAIYELQEKVRHLWEELTAELPPELIAEAEARGKEMDLEETAESLLAELD